MSTIAVADVKSLAVIHSGKTCLFLSRERRLRDMSAAGLQGRTTRKKDFKG